jgi:hypothetical protein
LTQKEGQKTPSYRTANRGALLSPGFLSWHIYFSWLRDVPVSQKRINKKSDISHR